MQPEPVDTGRSRGGRTESGVKPAPFAYRDPDSVDEVLALLAEHGDDAKLLAGGQSLGPMLNMRVVSPEFIVDLNRVKALSRRGTSADGGFAVGALVRQAELEDDPAFAAAQPLAAAALPWIAHRPIRNRGTVAGSLVHADPAAEWGGIILALDARLAIRRAGAPPREVEAENFFTGILESAVEAEDLLAEIRLPPWPDGARWGFREFARRRGDFALAGVACRFEVDGAGRCRSVRIGLVGVGDTAVRARLAESVLEGEPPGEELFADAAAAVCKEVAPLDDGHASAAYRSHLAGVVVADALAEAWERGGGNER